MAMAYVWTGMIALSILCSVLTGKTEAVAAAALSGASDAVTLCISMAGTLCLWNGVMSVMRASGLSAALKNLLRPALRLLYPSADEEALESIAANVSANLLGLGNAATPLGIAAARSMSRSSGNTASDDLCMLVVCNTASIQLIPATVAGVRAAAGAPSPFSILPAVWLASALSLSAGILAARIFSIFWKVKDG